MMVNNAEQYLAMVRSGRTTPRTYRLRPDTIARLNTLAARLRVGQSDLADYLLSVALTMAEQDTLTIPVVTPGVQTIRRT